ncbi:unnamed protein product [Cyclocybe aegerita]|uniref:Uncharacterized protein n=1 Tax=Cyclocybe aegerita TaxID=1973307 RepID=A0A8S0VXF8_CYCAE|nr:unnamed protein product [Cyclocybe aegerita]
MSRYSQSTYTYTRQAGETMSLTFNGTFIGIYGAKRPGYGLYQIELDGRKYPVSSAYSDVPLFNQTLFSADSLRYGLHTIKLVNAGNTTLDVDSVAFEGKTGRDDEELIPVTTQDNELPFSFLPASAWRPSPRPGAFSCSSAMVTSDPSARAEFKFRGICQTSSHLKSL